jgi:hypothetical protein
MLLLKLESEILSRVEYDESKLPQYATLSHTWEEDEITFEDMALERGRDKAGYHKLVRCGKQAADDGLGFFWADTCCVDRSSSAQLSEATNKTFQWFRNATRCYVFLADVSCPTGSDASSQQVLSAFRSSRWFTRSWTLQELLAPRVLDFFSAEGNRIGDRKSLIHEISNITGIPVRALDGDSLSEFSVEERRGWAAKRQATREEDRVYALLGICKAHMPLLYGEGLDRAELRLKNELDQGRHQISALFDSSHKADLYGNRLKGNQFRVLILHPGKQGSPITGYLQAVNLSDPPSYSALSYVWGEEPKLHPITINNQVTGIQPNLFNALQRIRDLQTRQFCIWVDSLCINQSDDIEKNEQIGRMSQIYFKADAVFVWLGEEDATSKIAIEFSLDVYQHSSKAWVEPGRLPSVTWSDTWWRDYSFTALSLLLERPWFRRGWVLQEAAFSTNSMIQCGDRQIHMKRFSSVIDLVRDKLELDLQKMDMINDRTKAGTLMNFIDSPAVSMLDIIKGAFEWSDKKGGFPNPKMSLETLVHRGTFSETSNERDAVYALLNLANDTKTISTSFYIVPDYRKSLLGVYTDFVRHCHSRSNSLDILCRPWAPAPSFQEHSNWKDGQPDQQLPSWIASRGKLPCGDPSWRLKHRLNGNPLIGSSLRPNYNAHGGTPAAVKWPTENCPKSIFVKGVLLTEVLQRSLRMANAIVTAESMKVLEEAHLAQDLPDYLRRTLCADRDDKGDPAPEYYKDAMREIVRISAHNNIMSKSVRIHYTGISIDVEELLEYKHLSKLSKDFLVVVRDVVWNRRTFRSKSLDAVGRHHIGLIPQNARVGDQICILYGCSVPVVLRQVTAPDKSYYWKLVGDAYVHGIMNGEAIQQSSKKELQSREMVFEIR